MPTDNLHFPARFIGYGAYNLCFDKKLGQWADKDQNGNTVMRNFFEFIRARPQYNAINLVKVICFRNSRQEELPAVVYNADGTVNVSSRTQPLFNRKHETNPHFLENLTALVREAKKHDFWVQVCIFHEQAVKALSDGSFENPEDMPAILDTRTVGNNCARLSTFFTIDDVTPAGKARLARQQKLAYEIAFALHMETNVLFEIGNELRIEGCDDDGPRNCKMVPWVQSMADWVLSGIFWDFDPSGTSTGTTNEHAMFDPQRPAACSGIDRWKPVFFDFHSGQWGIPQNDINSNGYIQGIPNAKNRATAYLGRAPMLIINDDGVKFGDEPNASDKQAHAILIGKWAALAFANGLHYSSKQQYPPVGWDIPALNALVGAIPQ